MKTTCFLTSVESFAEFNSAYEQVMGEHIPTRSTVGVQLAGRYLAEIEGIPRWGDRKVVGGTS